MSKGRHTPTPWHVMEGNFVAVVPEGFEEELRRTHYLGGKICETSDWDGKTHGFGPGGTEAGKNRARANAALIVRAVNAHEALVEALHALLDGVSDLDDAAREAFPEAAVEAAIAALALAEGSDKSDRSDK